MAGTNMTPIKVPGKNNRDQRRSGITANRNKRSQPPGRPPKSLASHVLRGSTPSPVESGDSRKRRSLKNIKSRRKMVKLEALPTEILTPIFLFSMNLELPRASPVIAGKLSSQLTILNAIANAFSPTWEYYYQLVQGHCETQILIPGDPKLQSAMLRCRCAKLLSLRRAEATFLRRIALEREPEPLTPCHDFLRQQSRWRHNATDDCFIDNYAHFKQLSNESIFKDMSYELIPRWVWSGFSRMHPESDIPESLLQGPWTPEMVEYLFWLIRAEARIHWTSSTNGEVALLGLKNAIATGNLQILHIFHYLGLAHSVTQEMLDWAIMHAGGDKLEVIARVMRMFVARGHGHNEFGLAHLEMAGSLSRWRVMAQRQSDEGQDKVKVIVLVKALENYWNFLSGAHNKIVAKGYNILGDRVL